MMERVVVHMRVDCWKCVGVFLIALRSRIIYYGTNLSALQKGIKMNDIQLSQYSTRLYLFIAKKIINEIQMNEIYCIFKKYI